MYKLPWRLPIRQLRYLSLPLSFISFIVCGHWIPYRGKTKPATFRLLLLCKREAGSGNRFHIPTLCVAVFTRDIQVWRLRLRADELHNSLYLLIEGIVLLPDYLSTRMAWMVAFLSLAEGEL